MMNSSFELFKQILTEEELIWVPYIIILQASKIVVDLRAVEW